MRPRELANRRELIGTGGAAPPLPTNRSLTARLTMEYGGQSG